MKRSFVILLFFISAIACAQNNDAETKQIADVLYKQTAAWNDGDIDVYMQGYWNNDSLLFIGSKGPVYGYKPTLERYKKSYPDKEAMGKLGFSDLTFKRLSHEYYFVTGRWSLQRDKDNPNGYFTLLFKLMNGQWQIVADHSS